MINAWKMDLSFDPEPLRGDLDQIGGDEWIKHFNTGYFEGEWVGIALRSVGGIISSLYSDPASTDPYEDTPILERCPNVRALLKTFHCPLRSVRLLKLGAGATIREHRDYDLGFERGQVRLHIPMFTNDHVEFFLDANPVAMKPGECWYLDLSLPHWVENRGSSDRIHLVIDCEPNDWLRRLLPAPEVDVNSSATPAHESSPEELERFRQAVRNDLDLQRRFRQTADRQSFIQLVVNTGREHGYRFTVGDADNALQAAQRAWIERWID